MYVYLLKNGRNGKIIEACDQQDNAATLKANLIKTGQYDTIEIEEVEVNTDYIEPLAVVKIRGSMKPTGPSFDVFAYNPDSVVEDTLIFTVAGNNISFSGFVNLTSGEKQLSDVDALKQRIGKWVSDSLAERLMNDNPI